MIIGKDNICPVTKLPCDDECCSPGSECNMGDDPSSGDDDVSERNIFKEALHPKENTKGLRYNDDKIRYDLFEPYALEQVARIFTKGAKKYAPFNWLKGMEWSKMIASMKRHIAAFEKGEDRDFDLDCEGCKEGTCVNHTGELHIAQAAWNALGLTSYYKHYPQGDDRIHQIMPKKKIGLDIDEVICEWVGDWTNYWKLDTPTSWFFDYGTLEKFEIMKKDKKLDGFYMNLKPKCSPCDIPFEPHCYVTSRPVSTEITKAWLSKHGFPTKPVITVGVGESKVDAIKASGLDIFVDDRYDNYEELNRNGICCYLFDAPHNTRYNVGYRRIKSLSELKF